MATRTWNAAAGQTDMNNGSNYTPTGAILTGDDLVFDATSVVNATASANLSVASITVAALYTGNFTISGRTITLTGSFDASAYTKTITATGGTTINIGGNLLIGTGVTLASNLPCPINFTGTPTITVVTKILSGLSTFSNGATFVGAVSNTYGRIKFAINSTYTFAAGSITTISSYTANDWSGTAGNLVTFVSSVAGTQYTITPSVDVTASYMSISDCINGSTTKVIDVSDGTSTRSTTGMGTKDVKWPTDIIYHDPGMANDTGNGLSMSTAKKLRQSAYNLISNAGDIVLCRRNTTETPSATLTYPTFANGTPSNPIKIICFPRNALSFTGTWVNNVNAIWGLNITADVEQHIGRWVRNDTDGYNYLITDLISEVNWDGKANGGLVAGTAYTGQTSNLVWTCLYNIDNGDNTGKAIFWKWVTASGRAQFVDNDNLRVSTTTYAVVNGTPTTCFCIDRPYPGENATSASGTIAKDEDYDWSQTLTSGQGADLLSTWTADANDMPIIDWNAGLFIESITKYWYEFHNLIYKNSAFSGAGISNSSTQTTMSKLLGCYFTSNNIKTPVGGANMHIERCVIDMASSSTPTSAISAGVGVCIVRSSAMHHSSGIAAHQFVRLILENVNIGVEKESTTSEISLSNQMPLILAKDIQFGSLSTIVLYTSGGINGNIFNQLCIQNFNKVQNSHRVYIPNTGTIIKNDCSGGDVVARTGGASSVAEFLINYSSSSSQTKAPTGISSIGYCFSCIEMKVWLNTTDILSTQNFKFYVQSVTDALTSADMWLECEYIDKSTAQGYHKTIVTSSESIAARNSASDWTQFISTGNITVAAAGWVILRIFDNKYSTNKKYVDPMYDGAQVAPLWSMGQPMVEMQTQDFPLPANVLTIDTTNNVLGTFNEATRNTDPGITNVKLNTAYKIQNASLTGSYSPPAGGGAGSVIGSAMIKGVL
jgi:hypothetical protein